MSFFKKLFGKKSQPVDSYAAFWVWFEENAPTFFPIVKRMGNIQRDFFSHVSPKLMALHEGYYLLTGMKDPETAELVFTAEGNLRNFIFVEELVAAAPKIPGWTFTAHKPAIDSIEFGVEMEGIQFDHKTLHFYPIEDPEFPDLIQIAVVHRDMNPENRSVIENGCFVFLDNYLGELRVVTEIDQVYVVAKGDAASEVITMNKLSPYLTWRHAEFVEKYEGERRNTDDDQYSGLQATLPNGKGLIAIINQDLLQWDRKASHPWMLIVEIGYPSYGDHGMPDESTADSLNAIEDKIIAQLPDHEGYLNIGRQTSENLRSIFIACRDFRKPSKVMEAIEKEYKGSFQIEFEIFKDKYWRSVERFAKP
jgi:hypothetical protein